MPQKYYFKKNIIPESSQGLKIFLGESKKNMKVGFLGFGEVASTLSNTLTCCGAEVYTSLENRSIKTQTLAKESAVNVCKDNHALAELSDVLISSVVPVEAVNIAKEVGRYVNGIYVDVNNISPQTAVKALSYIDNGKTVDAAIMGGIKKEKVFIIASGDYANKFSLLNDYGLNITVLKQELGRAKALKMLRSYYTKGISALLFESLFTAHKLGMDDEFLRCLEITECPGFKESAISRIKNSTYHAQRKSQEMDEVYKFIKDNSQDGSGKGKFTDENQHLVMVKATQEFFKTISSILNLDEEPESYQELFNLFKYI